MSGDETGARLEKDSPLSAEESLALIERQQREVHRALGVNVALFYGPWGAAYLLGFGAIFLTYPTAGAIRLPVAVAVAITAVLFASAVVITAVTGARAGRGLRGRPRRPGPCMAGAGVLASAHSAWSTPG